MADEFSAERSEVREPLVFRDIAIVGGGCYGSFYAGQLKRALERGKVRYRRLLVVDRDPGCRAAQEPPHQRRVLVSQEWGAFFDAWLADGAANGDAIVPSPLMPHLMFEWLLRRAALRWPGRQVAAAPVSVESRTPYDMLAPDGIRYVSYADWLCPTHCIEPALCPATRAPRTWEMSDALAEMTRRMSRDERMAGPVVLRCRHRAFGVGMFDVDEVLAADRIVAEAGRTGDPVRLLVGTVSSCHGAVGLVRLGAAEPAGSSIFHGFPAPGQTAPSEPPTPIGANGNE